LAETVPGVKEIRNEVRALPLSNYDDQLRITAARQLRFRSVFSYCHQVKDAPRTIQGQRRALAP
jgi:hypothetical protein